jgi:HPt (histidine-containing phosphotransfer) domain-containing protein
MPQGTEDEGSDLREKARLLLQRERELFELRLKHEQLALWLKVGQVLPDLFLNPSESPERIWDRVRKTLIGKLRLQRVLILEVGASELLAVAPTAPPRPLPGAVAELLKAQPSGFCNDPAANTNSPSVRALAETLGLHRFVWSRISPTQGSPILIAGGFDQTKAEFQAPFGENDAAHFNNATQHLESLLRNYLLVVELEREKTQLQKANQNLEQRDQALRHAAEELRAANETLERRVDERTRELASRNRELRLVFDNVDQALLTVNMAGQLAPEHSSVVEHWFGTYAAQTQLVELLQADRAFDDLFELGLQSLTDDVLPREVCLAQMPKQLISGKRTFACRFLPIDEGGRLVGLLVIINDITEQLMRAKQEAKQRELLAAFTALMSDRNGFVAFFEESKQILADLDATDSSRSLQQRQLHTLKGNASSFGLQTIADLCHAAESELQDDGAVREDTIAQLRSWWHAVSHTLQAVIPADSLKLVQVSEEELARLKERARQGVSAALVVEELERLRWEPIARPLQRLARHAEALASRLGKAPLNIQLDAEALWLDPDHWAPLWSSLVHVVRNAVDHGIESPAERAAADKPAHGRLQMKARRERPGYVLELVDDGRGIDWDSVRRLYEQRGGRPRSRADLVDALLSPGFSTREHVTETSGRGVGLAAVAAAVTELGGKLGVESEPGRGTCWTIAFPKAIVDTR